MQGEKVVFPSGRTGTRVPRLDLIPYAALCRIADRFELGLERHKERAWNARNQDQASLTDKEWVISRCVHAIHHAMKLIEKIEGGGFGSVEDDDAAAIAWAGVFLCEATTALGLVEKGTF